MNTPKNAALLTALAAAAMLLSAAAIVSLWMASAQEPAAHPGSREDTMRVVRV